ASARAWPIAAADVTPFAASACARPQHLLAAAATEVHTVLRAAGNGIAIAAKFLRDIGVGIAHAVPMVRIVLPVSDIDIVDVDFAIDVDVVAAPIKTAAPVIAARGPAAKARPVATTPAAIYPGAGQ